MSESNEPELWWVERVVAAKVTGNPKQFLYKTKYAGYKKFYWEPLESFLAGNSKAVLDEFWEGQMTGGCNPYDVRQFLIGEDYAAPGHRRLRQQKRPIQPKPKGRSTPKRKTATSTGRRPSSVRQTSKTSQSTPPAQRTQRRSRSSRKARRA